MPSQCKPFHVVLLLGLLLLATSQLIFLVYIIKETYIAGPVQDSWGIIPYIKQTLAADNWFNADLWTSQNSHRLVLLRLEFLIEYFYFHGSNFFLIGLSSLLVVIEIALLAWLLNIQKKSDTGQWIILLSAALLISFPTIAWSFLHIFNIQMLELAVFAVLACVLMSKALSQHNHLFFVAGLIAAILCNLSAFSITTIWPALIFLLLLNRADKFRIGALAGIAIIFSFIYLKYLPATQTVYLSTAITSGLFKYLISYLSLPPADNLFLQLITLLTLIWFIFGTYVAIKHPSSQEEKTALSFMCFGICLGITTGIGRGYLGDLGIGDRFQPLVLVYWIGFVLHLSFYLKNKQKTYLFNIAALLIFCFITTVSFINSLDTGKKLTEDYTRFAKMQMAYLSDNFSENAIYENMVPEWRNNSYPGIVATIPYLKENQLGIFNSPVALYIEQHKYIDINSMKNAACISGKLVEKTRNNDPLIRNILFESENKSDAKNYPYLLFYTDQKISGIAFKKRLSLQQLFKEHGSGRSTWLGITRVPSAEKTIVIGFHSENKNCQVEVTKFAPSGERVRLD